MFSEHKVTIITGKPANGKSTALAAIRDALSETVCIEGDDFITPIGKTRLNSGKWNDTDRKLYLSRMAATAVEAVLDHQSVIIADCLTTQWMRTFLEKQILAINENVAVAFILLERALTPDEVLEIGQIRQAQGHPLDPEALVAFRDAFEPWHPDQAVTIVHNDGDLQLLLKTLKPLL